MSDAERAPTTHTGLDMAEPALAPHKAHAGLEDSDDASPVASAAVSPAMHAAACRATEGSSEPSMRPSDSGEDRESEPAGVASEEGGEGAAMQLQQSPPPPSHEPEEEERQEQSPQETPEAQQKPEKTQQQVEAAVETPAPAVASTPPRSRIVSHEHSVESAASEATADDPQAMLETPEVTRRRGVAVDPSMASASLTAGLSANPLLLFSPTRPPETPAHPSAGAPHNAPVSPTSPAIPPRPARPPRPVSAALMGAATTGSATTAGASPASASKGGASTGSASQPYSRRDSLLAKSHLSFKACLKHQFPLLDAQVAGGQALVKRVANFLRKFCDTTESHAASMLKLTQQEESKSDLLRQADAMQDHFKATAQLTATIEALALRDQSFAQKVNAAVVKPLLAWLPGAEERRSKLIKEEKNSSSSLASKNMEADKIRVNGVKLWSELLQLRKEREQETQNVHLANSAGGAAGLTPAKAQERLEKVLKKLAKVKENARKEFHKYESLRESVIARNMEWRTVLLPNLLQEMEQLERERLAQLKRVLSLFTVILRESVGSDPPNLSILSVVEQQVALLSADVDLNRFIEHTLLTHGMPPSDPALVGELPCSSDDLAPESDRWEAFALGPPAPSSPAPSHTRGISAALTAATAIAIQSDSLTSIREEGAGTSESAAASAADAEDDDDDDEDETLSTALPQSIGEDWYVAQVEHPSAAAANASTPPCSSDLPLLHFSVDDIVRVTDKVSAGEGWWLGSNVGVINGPIGRFPRALVRSINDKWVEPVETNAEASASAGSSLTDMLRGKVSKKKKRFQQDGFDLDLTYILPNIIAMGFPSEGLEATYRNPMPSVQRFFNQRHPNNYKLYNLCEERSYEHVKFDGRVSHYGFADHNPCPFRMLLPIMQDIHAHLHPNGELDPNRVAAIHCKAGKGRTGLIIVCWLLYSGLFPTYEPELALRFYAVKRTKNQKGVTISSQIRYAQYFARWLRMERGLARFPRVPERNPVLLQSIRLLGIPPSTRGKDVWFKLVQSDGKYSSKGRLVPERRVAEDYILLSSGSGTGIAPLDHDVTVHFYTGGMFDTTKLFAFWFNTRFIGMMDGNENNEKEVEADDNGTRTLVLTKAELDKACKDVNHKLFLDTFRVELVFTSA